MNITEEVDSSVFADEWEAHCKADFKSYKSNHPMPFIANFWSGAAFFNARERWSEDYRRHYTKMGEEWWNQRGFTVTAWPRSTLPITVAALAAQH